LQKKPDLIISGINYGANLGRDIYYSGTVAAAREGCFAGLRSIAVSLALGFAEEPKVIIGTRLVTFIQKFLPEFERTSLPRAA